MLTSLPSARLRSAFLLGITILLAAGDAGDTVGPGNSDRMAAQLKAAGNSATVIKYPGVGHIGIILSLLPGFRGKTRLRDDVTDFIQSH